MSESRKAAVHDLGYSRYAGTRRPQRTRYQVIVRNLLSMSWQGWWRYKMILGLAVMAIVIIGAIMYVSRQRFLPGGGNAVFQTEADAMIPLCFAYLAQIIFVLSLTVLASAISRDLKAGAFEFYFSRPVRPLDYVLGKVGGAFLLIAPVLIGAPTLLTLYRMGLTGSVDDALSALPWIPKAILVGTVGSLAFALIPLACGALSSKPSYAIAGYAALTLIVGGIFIGVAEATHVRDLEAMHPIRALDGFASGIFGAQSILGSFSGAKPGLLASTISLLGYAGVSLGIIFWRVRAAQRAGMGGG